MRSRAAKVLVSVCWGIGAFAVLFHDSLPNWLEWAGAGVLITASFFAGSTVNFRSTTKLFGRDVTELAVFVLCVIGLCVITLTVGMSFDVLCMWAVMGAMFLGQKLLARPKPHAR